MTFDHGGFTWKFQEFFYIRPSENRTDQEDLLQSNAMTMCPQQRTLALKITDAYQYISGTDGLSTLNISSEQKRGKQKLLYNTELKNSETYYYKSNYKHIRNSYLFKLFLFS